MEPERITDPKHLDVLRELEKREPIFHRPELGTTRRDFERMTEEDFWEVGASGRRYLLTYTLLQGERVTRRATLWRRRGGEWKIVYHQGTIVSSEAGE